MLVVIMYLVLLNGDVQQSEATYDGVDACWIAGSELMNTTPTPYKSFVCVARGTFHEPGSHYVVPIEPEVSDEPSI